MTLGLLERVVVTALNRAYDTHQALGEQGLTLVKSKNEIGGDALLCDYACEEAVIHVCRGAGLPIRIISEEHGCVDMCKDPTLLGVLDGIDGTSVYKSKRGTGRYGTMFAIFEGTDPRYDDFLAAGVIEHRNARMTQAVRGGGTFVTLGPRVVAKGATSDATWGPELRVRWDDPWQYNQRMFGALAREYDATMMSCSAVNYTDLAIGDVDLVLECTRKGNLEIGVAYGIVKESEGVMVDVYGRPLGPQKFLAFGQKKHLGVISACSQSISDETLRRISP